jgi:hypothetical protein
MTTVEYLALADGTLIDVEWDDETKVMLVRVGKSLDPKERLTFNVRSWREFIPLHSALVIAGSKLAAKSFTDDDYPPLRLVDK